MAVQHRAKIVGAPTPSRRIVTGRKSSFTGQFPSRKNRRLVAYESLLAREFMARLEHDDRVISYQEEPSPFRWDDGWRHHTYWPDVAVHLVGGFHVCVEVKPLRKVLTNNLLPVYEQIAKAACAFGYDRFELWTDREIRSGPALANAYLLSRGYSQIVDPEQLHIVRVAIDRLGGRARVGDIRRASGLGSQSFRAIVQLLARGELRQVRLEQAIDDRMVVEVPRR